MIEGFPFDDVDLATNRRGQLTDAQRAKVRAELDRRTRILAVLLLAGPPLAAAAIWGAAELVGDPIPVRTAIALVYTITLLLAAPLLGIALYSNYVRPVRTGRVHSYTGKLRLKPKGSDIHLRFGSGLSAPRFAVSPDQAAALTEGDRYTVYFTPGGSRALFHSMEQLFEPTTDATIENEGS
ncbi:MAG: hypothetical protein AAFN30_20455 [Actinomycetota bacterium]